MFFTTILSTHHLLFLHPPVAILLRVSLLAGAAEEAAVVVFVEGGDQQKVRHGTMAPWMDAGWGGFLGKLGFFFTIWLFNIAMENGPFIDGSPIKNGDFP